MGVLPTTALPLVLQSPELEEAERPLKEAQDARWQAVGWPATGVLCLMHAPGGQSKSSYLAAVCIPFLVACVPNTWVGANAPTPDSTGKWKRVCEWAA